MAVVSLLLGMCTAAMGEAVGAEPKLRVALFTDPGSTDRRSREAIWRILGSQDCLAAERITTAGVAAGRLESTDVLVIPGGTANGIARALGLDGCRLVTDRVRQGMGCVAVCAGGYLAVEGWSTETRAIELLNAKSWDDEHWARGEGFIAVKVVGVEDAQASRTMWFENGPIFAPGSLPAIPPYAPLVRYVTDLAAKDAPTGMMAGRDAAIAGFLGKGRVVAFGPHPELSPGLSHWLVNSVRWTGARDTATTATAARVLGEPN
jgi:glutamine amidotransferase-like uncharacterized protein